MRPPKRYKFSRITVWKLNKTVYVGVECGILWQLMIELWMNEFVIAEIPCLTRLIIYKNSTRIIYSSVLQ